MLDFDLGDFQLEQFITGMGGDGEVAGEAGRGEEGVMEDIVEMVTVPVAVEGEWPMTGFAVTEFLHIGAWKSEL